MIVGNEEPQYTEIANVQLADASHKLPELTRLPPCSIPRPFGFEHLIHQWQPMGIRVTLNIPFTGNDKDYIFAIRNGPFIPTMFYNWQDTSCLTDWKDNVGPDPTKRHLANLDTYQSYATNNMLNVQHAYSTPQKIMADKSAIVITQFDQPPILASLATMFRKWRGTMHYRVRVVAGFTTQGYIFVTLVRNSQPIVGIYPTNSFVSGVQTEDTSYRPGMVNSYIMGDTAMFRHYEFQVPFEYPVPFYDQFNWIGNRSRPADLYAVANNPTTKKDEALRLRSVINEPHGDNYCLIGLRGVLNSSVSTAQITFELEYRAGDDFQFADPFLPFDPLYLVPKQNSQNAEVPIIQIPASTYTTDGLHEFKKNKPTVAAAKAAIVENQMINLNRPNRRPRDLSGYDTVDDTDLESEVGDPPDILDLKRNLRKSLNR